MPFPFLGPWFETPAHLVAQLGPMCVPAPLPSPKELVFFADATKITLAPSSADINLGANLTLQCHASHDPTMDLTFTWALDGFAIDIDKPGAHYRRASSVSLRPSSPPPSRAPSPSPPGPHALLSYSKSGAPNCHYL